MHLIGTVACGGTLFLHRISRRIDRQRRAQGQDDLPNPAHCHFGRSLRACIRFWNNCEQASAAFDHRLPNRRRGDRTFHARLRCRPDACATTRRGRRAAPDVRSRASSFNGGTALRANHCGTRRSWSNWDRLPTRRYIGSFDRLEQRSGHCVWSLAVGCEHCRCFEDIG